MTDIEIKLTLKAIRCLPHLSRETHCFTSTLYLNGKHAAYVDSDGRGGDPDVIWSDPITRNLVEGYFAQQPRQRRVGSYGTYDYQPNLETWTLEQINKHLLKQSRALARRAPKRAAAEYRVVD
jgi:hypothetical protein